MHRDKDYYFEEGNERVKGTYAIGIYDLGLFLLYGLFWNTRGEEL